MGRPHHQTYDERADGFSNPAAKRLLKVMASKQSNLAVSVDATNTEDFLSIVDIVGPFVCLIKVRPAPA
jgi:orotidine-5'-phosphate decarboxylase